MTTITERPMTTLAIIEYTAPLAQRAKGRLWTPPWTAKPLAAWDGRQEYDLQGEAGLESLRRALEAAGTVIIHQIPTAMAAWNVNWRPLDVVERALRLGSKPSTDLLGLVAAYVLSPAPWQWHPEQPPWRLGAIPTSPALIMQAKAVWQVTGDVYKAQQAIIASRGAPGLETMLAATAGPLDAIYRRMSTYGLNLDPVRRTSLLQAGDGLLRALQGTLTGHGLTNPDSDDFLTAWLKGQGVIERGAKPRSWDDDKLKELCNEVGMDDKWPADRQKAITTALWTLRRYRRLAAILAQGWLGGTMDGPDGRIHPIHVPFAQPTGRTTTLYPTVTSTPKELRPLIVPTTGQGIFETDFVAAEVGIATARFQDHAARELYLDESPIGAIAKRLFPDRLANTPSNAVKKTASDLYDIAKIATYGSLYGMGPRSLGRQIGRSEAEAKMIAARLAQEVWPDVERGLQAEAEKIRRMSRDDRWVEITPGLRRDLSKINEAHRLRTIPRNTPIQGLCAAVFRRACIYADQAITPLGGRLLLPVHDSLVAEAPLDRLDEACIAVKAAMERAAHDELGGFLSLKAETDRANVAAWCKKGRVDSVDEFIKDPNFRI